MKNLNTDYRSILRYKLEERCIANPLYSLRAFSRDLDISPASLSLILRNKKGLSANKAESIAQKLGLIEDQKFIFLKKVEASDARSKKSRSQALKDLKKIFHNSDHRTLLQLDTFTAISDWHHLAILELTKLKGFRPTAIWISNRLGISEDLADQAVQRLFRLKLLKRYRGTYRLSHINSFVTSAVPSESIQNFHRQIVEKSKTSISQQLPDERELSSMVFAVNKKSVPRLKEKIRIIHKEMSQEIDSSEFSRNPDEVYCFSVQLFRLTEKEIK